MIEKKKTGIFQQYLKQPNTVGAIAASGPWLAQAMVNEIDWQQARTIVEYGPGTGAITQHILHQIRDEHNFFAVEINADLVTMLAHRFPQLRVYHDSATHIATICEQHGVEGLDAVISGLPWTVFGEQLQQDLLESMQSVLRPGAVFVTFAYLSGLPFPGARRFLRKLKDSFSSVTISKPVWKNFPPAIVYTCRV